MTPDTSNWRTDSNYDFLDTLPIEGLAWECLRRFVPYQEHYSGLVGARAEALPLTQEAQQLWGLRFRGETKSFCRATTGGVVAISRSDRYPTDWSANLPTGHLKYTRRQVRRGA